MAALIRQTNNGYELANRPRTHTKKKTTTTTTTAKGKKDVWWKRREGKQNNNKLTLSEKKEAVGNVSEQRDKGWIHVTREHDTTHLAVTTTLQGRRRSLATPHKERLSGLVKPRDNPPHSYIVNERYNSRNKRASKEKK